jgi:hypothetical protein
MLNGPFDDGMQGAARMFRVFRTIQRSAAARFCTASEPKRPVRRVRPRFHFARFTVANKIGYGLTAFPFQHSFSGPSSKIAKCKCGEPGSAFPVDHTNPITAPGPTTPVAGCSTSRERRPPATGAPQLEVARINTVAHSTWKRVARTNQPKHVSCRT